MTLRYQIAVTLLALAVFAWFVLTDAHPTISVAEPIGPQWHDVGAGLKYVDLDHGVRCYRDTAHEFTAPLSCVVLP